MAARNYSDIAVQTTLASGISDSDTSLSVASATGWPAAPFLLVLDPDTANEEVVLVGAKSGTTFSSLTRGFAGTSASSHNASIDVQHVITGTDVALIWSHDHSGDYTAVDHGNLVGVGVDDHHARDHSLTGATHTASGLTAGHALVATGTTTFGFAAVDHGNLAGLADDDHTQYLDVTRHDSDDHSALPEAAVTAHEAALTITESQISDLDHDDAEAIHDNVSGEINAVTVKGSPESDDIVLIEDSAATFAKKKATLGSIVSALTEVDHGALTGLSDDDHTQYLLKAGGTMTGALLAADGSVSLPSISFAGDGNTGFYITGNDGEIRFSGNGTAGGSLMGVGIRTVAGSAGVPSHSFSSDTDIGMYRVGTNILGFATAGAAAMTLEANGSARFSDGSLSLPGISFINDADMGFYRDTAFQIRWGVSATFGGYLSGQGVGLADGSNPATPGFHWANDPNTGMYRPAADTLGFAAAGVNVARMIDGGSTSSLFIQDGLTAVGDQTTLRIARGSGGSIVAVGYHSSSLEHKDKVETLNKTRFWDRSKFMDIRAITYVRNSGPDEGMREFSFGAEDLDALSPMLTTGGDKTSGGSVSLTGLMAVVVDYIQYLEGRVTALEGRLSRA